MAVEFLTDARRTAEGRTLPEIVRCLMRFVARERYPLLVAPAAGPSPRLAAALASPRGAPPRR